MIIELPKSFEAKTAFTFSSKISDFCESKEELTFRFNDKVNAQPAGLLLIGTSLRKMKEFKNIRFDNISEYSYLGSMGFFHSIKEDKGIPIERLKGSDRFIPITRKDIIEECRKDFLVNGGTGNPEDIIENIARVISKLLSNVDKKLYETCYYSIVEIIRNVNDHSGKSVLWYSAQYWPSKGKVEIAILDEGCGILSSFKKSHKYKHLENDYDAICESVKEGVTRSNLKQAGLDYSENTGYGLFKIKSICEIGGELTITSGNTSIIFAHGDTLKYESNLKGTMISITLYEDRVISRKEELDDLLHPKVKNDGKR